MIGNFDNRDLISDKHKQIAANDVKNAASKLLRLISTGTDAEFQNATAEYRAVRKTYEAKYDDYNEIIENWLRSSGETGTLEA